ncbi:hypothetical protein [Lentzea sp. NPDC060358]|uniref:hypothetical protein n=1 Tax=Lentzea sp. NPDC060358 TaxID=3347103 RepID=UPI003659B242
MQEVAETAPLFDTGDKIALGAAIVALIAMGIAIWQAYEARQSRKATRDQADTAEKALGETKRQSAAAEKSATAAMLSLGAAERAASASEEQVLLARQAVKAAEAQALAAQRANEIALLQDTNDQADRDEAAKAEARQIRGALANMGGLSLTVTNHGSETVHDLELEHVEAIGFPELTWRANPRTMPIRSIWDTISPGQQRTFFIDFTDADGNAHRAPSREYRYTLSYTNNSGRWRRVGNADPTRVEQVDDRAARAAQELGAASDSDRALRLLRVLADRLATGTPININALPEQLDLSEAVVQQALRRLHERDFINALTGDDKILSVREITASGQDALERSGF